MARHTAWLLAGLALGAWAAPPASATSLYDQNAAELRAQHPGATEAQVAEIAGMLAARGVALGGPPTQAVDPDMHIGEVWTLCEDVSWFFGGGPHPCNVSSLTPPTGIPCASLGLHWAVFVWAAATLSWTITGGTSTVTYFWTEGHFGLGPMSQPGGGTFYGSGCVFHVSFGPGDEIAFGYGVGIFHPE